MKKLIPFLFLLGLPALAQTGGSSKTIVNLAPSCLSTVVAGTYCGGYGRTWCVNYNLQEVWACDPFVLQWKKVGDIATGTGGGGAGTSTIQENSTSASTTAAILDFLSGFDVVVSTVNTPNDKVTISLDYTENPVSLGTTQVTGTLPVNHGGTNAVVASGARANLGAAASGINADITSLTNLTTPLPLNEGGTGVNTAASLDDKLLLGQPGGTTAAWAVLTNCTTGNQMLYDASTNTFGCEADGSAGTGTFRIMQEEGVAIGASGSGTTINFTGTAITASGTGATKTVALAQSGTGTAVVDNAYTVTAGAGLGGGGALTSTNTTLTTASQEAGFLADGGATPLTCGASNQGKTQVMDNGVKQWCDGATTSVLQYSALGDSSGNALTGSSATTFFSSGTLPVARGGTGAASLGTAKQVLFNDGGVVGVDETGSSFAYDKSTDTLSVGSVSTYGAADNFRYLELQGNTGDVGTPSSGFARFYASGSSGSEVFKYKTAAGTVFTFDSLTGANTLTNHTFDGNSNDLAIRRHATDCTALTDGVTGEPCYEQDADTLYVCEPTAGLCDTAAEWRSTAGAGGSGDITQVWQTASGAASAIVGSTGDSLDASAADFLRVPIDKTIDTAGKIDVDTTTTLDQLQVFMGGAVRAFSPIKSAGAVLESLVSTDDNYEFYEAPENVTVIGVSCRCRGTCSTTATFTLEDRAGNAMTITGTNPTCSTTGNSTFAAVTAANTLATGEGLAFDVTNSPTTGDTYTITVQYTVDPQ